MVTTNTIATAPPIVTSIPNIKKSRDPSDIKPYNRYNIYYILERERFLQSNSNYKRKDVPLRTNFTTGYEGLELPEFPPRYTNLDMPLDWYMPGKRKAAKRNHKKSHGLASFQEIARIVADGYKDIDDVTLEYVTIVANISKQRYNEIKAAKRKEFDRRLTQLTTSIKLTQSLPVLESTSTPSIDNATSSLLSRIYEKANLASSKHKQSATHPARIDHVTSPSITSTLSVLDLSLKSATAVSVKAATCISPPSVLTPSILSGVCTPAGSCSATATDKASSSQVIHIPPRTVGYADIDDGDIMKMWHFN